MNLLVVGVSHHTAPVELLERLAVTGPQVPSMLANLVAREYVSEAVVLSTCNRVEVYAAVTAFHGGLADIAAILGEWAGLDVSLLAAHLYVHYDVAAARHALRVAAGLDSMVVGEAQILGQLRDAYGVAGEQDSAGRLLHELMQQALRVGKRVHAETGIDRAGQSVVTAALGFVPDGLVDKPAFVIGAGSMGSLALATLNRAEARPLYVTNRGADRASRLAELHRATHVDFADLGATLSTVDIVVCATASPAPVLTVDLVRAAIREREERASASPAVADERVTAGRTRPLAILDLAIPRDVEPEVADLPGVVVVDMASLASSTLDKPSTVDRDAADAIIEAEVEAFLTWLRGNDVAPTVAALRARADEVVSSELSRLVQRRPDLTSEQRSEVAHALHRVVQRLLHSPTVRVRELAATPGGDQYAALLRELFDLAVPPVPDHGVGRAMDVEGGKR